MKNKVTTNSRRKKNPVKPRPMSKRLMMRRAIAIPLQTIRATKSTTSTQDDEQQIKRQKGNSLVPQISIQATPTPLLVAIVSQLLIHR